MTQPLLVMRRPSSLPSPDRCLVMGIVNVTPDSFSDGGLFATHESAIRHGLELVNEGADIVDVGGESTRPGAARVSEKIELRRVIAVVKRLADAGVVVSVDTMRARVAAEAVAAGAMMVNDVSGGLADEAMPRLVAQLGVPYVVTHWRGHGRDMQQRAVYGDVVAEVRLELSRRLDALVAAGVAREQIVLDPGIGFAKEADHSWSLLDALPAIAEIGRPLLVGASRKSLLSDLEPDAQRRTTRADRDSATAAITALVARDAYCVRVHAVRANAVAVRVAARLAHRTPRGCTLVAERGQA